MAHWIDADAAATALDSWKGRTAVQLAEDQSFYDALATVDIEKRFRLEFVHKATGKQVSEGFEDSLKIIYPTLPPDAKAFLGMFKSKLKVGDTVEIRWLPGGTIEVYENGARVDVLKTSIEFAGAIWKIWFNEKLADDHLVTVKKELLGNIQAIWDAQDH